jgi:hypothetical protein
MRVNSASLAPKEIGHDESTEIRENSGHFSYFFNLGILRRGDSG